MLRAYGRGAESHVLIVLHDAGHAIALFRNNEARSLARAKRFSIDARYVHNAAAEVGLLLGRGAFRRG